MDAICGKAASRLYFLKLLKRILVRNQATPICFLCIGRVKLIANKSYRVNLFLMSEINFVQRVNACLMVLVGTKLILHAKTQD